MYVMQNENSIQLQERHNIIPFLDIRVCSKCFFASIRSNERGISYCEKGISRYTRTYDFFEQTIVLFPDE